MDPINTPPASAVLEPATPETNSLTDAFLSGKLPFQSEASTSTEPAVAASGVEVDPQDDTFEAQAAREGWNIKPAETAPPTEPAPAQTAATPAPRPGGRDYAGLDPADVAVFKQMSNEAYARLRPVYDRHREWEAQKADREAKELERSKLIDELKGHHYYDLPDAWQLDPDVKPLAAAQQQLSNEADFWQQQLAAIDRNEKIRLLVADNEGRPTLTAPIDPEPEHRAIITRAMHDALTKHSQVSAQLTQNVQNFKARYKGWDDLISEQNQRVFGAHEKHIAKTRDEILNQFPAALRHRPIYNYAANATAAISMLLRDNETLKRRLAGQQINQPALASATPKPTQQATTGGAGDIPAGLRHLLNVSGRNYQLPS